MTRFLLASLTSLLVASAQAATSCPPEFDGHRLRLAELYSGPPGHEQPEIPEIGGWKIAPIPGSEWGRVPPAMLGCTYHDKPELLKIPIPRKARYCKVIRTGNAICR